MLLLLFTLFLHQSIIQPVVYFFNPYSVTGDLGQAYNQYMELLPTEEDWAVLTDGDTSWLMPKYGHQIQEIINQQPETGIFTCLTNRVGSTEQCYRNRISPERDMLKHKIIALDCDASARLKVKEIRNIISGHCMVVQKKTWLDVGKFDENIGILAVDNMFSRKILDKGYKILLMEGVYLWHYYRLDTGVGDKSHLTK